MTPHTPAHRIIKILRDPAAAFTPKVLELFSDLTPAETDQILPEWSQVTAPRRRSLVKKLVEYLDDDTVVSFEAFALSILRDPDSQVRASAISLLWDSGQPHIARLLIDILRSDPAAEVRAESATVLGSYIYLGELEELDAALLGNIEDALLSAAQKDPDAHTQRKAVEALGFSSRPEVPALLESAYRHVDPHWTVSALFAMGRSNDPRWEELVIRSLAHEMPQVRLAAVEAAGALELAAARDILLRLLDEEEDEDLLRAEIWSLSQIGGDDVRTYLDNLLDTVENDELAFFIEEALDNLTFTEGRIDLGLDLMAFDPEDIEKNDKKG